MHTFSELYCWFNISESFKAVQEHKAAESLLFTWSPNCHDQIFSPTLHVSLEFCQCFTVILQGYGQLLAKVLTLSRFWTCLHMAMKFYYAVNFNAVVNFAIFFSCSTASLQFFHFLLWLFFLGAFKLYSGHSSTNPSTSSWFSLPLGRWQCDKKADTVVRHYWMSVLAKYKVAQSGN